MDKFRVLSDLHIDINEKFPFSIDDTSIFTVVAGDTCGHPYVISAKCSNSHVGIKIENSLKAGRFFGKAKRATVVYNAAKDEWTYKGKPIPDDAISMSINGVWTSDFSKKENEKPIPDGEKVIFHVTNIEKWLRDNIDNGILIAGNHLVYNRNGMSIEELKRNLGATFPSYSNITFLDQSIGVMTKEVDGILFVGSTLYTDYKLPIRGTKNVSEAKTIEYNKRIATPKMSGGGLNDFNWGKTEEATYNKAWIFEGDSDLSYLTPNNYERFFHRTFDAIKKIVEENPDKEIVVVTHHCPSTKCISAEYIGSDLNSSYVSDLDDFILSHPNIKCWICGHVHHRASFKIGGCLVVMNPLGYCKYGEYLSSHDGVSGEWTPNTFVNTKTWELEKEAVDLTKWGKRREKYEKEREKWYRKYGGFFF